MCSQWRQNRDLFPRSVGFPLGHQTIWLNWRIILKGKPPRLYIGNNVCDESGKGNYIKVNISSLIFRITSYDVDPSGSDCRVFDQISNHDQTLQTVMKYQQVRNRKFRTINQVSL